MEDAFHAIGRQSDLRLIETVLWTGDAAPRWPLHLARLERSFALLGWGKPEVPPLPEPQAPARLRLSMAQTPGGGAWQVFDLPGPPAPSREMGGTGGWRIGLSPHRLASNDPYLRIKSNRRALHDLARAEMAAGLDEVILLNERDEVCEGSITNLFFDRGAGLRTPPLACGLLPGVLRAEIAAPEEILLAKDLGHVRLWLGNALRGLIPVHFIDL